MQAQYQHSFWSGFKVRLKDCNQRKNLVGINGVGGQKEVSRIENLIGRRRVRPAHHTKEIRDSLPLGDRIEKEQPIQFKKAERIIGQGWIPSLEESKNLFKGKVFILCSPFLGRLYQRVKELTGLYHFPFFLVWPFQRMGATFDTWLATPIEAGWVHLGPVTHWRNALQAMKADGSAL